MTKYTHYEDDTRIEAPTSPTLATLEQAELLTLLDSIISLAVHLRTDGPPREPPTWPLGGEPWDVVNSPHYITTTEADKPRPLDTTCDAPWGDSEDDKWCPIMARYCHCDPRCENHGEPEQDAPTCDAPWGDCNYPDCDCAISFPEGHKPSLVTECPRAANAPWRDEEIPGIDGEPSGFLKHPPLDFADQSAAIDRARFHPEDRHAEGQDLTVTIRVRGDHENSPAEGLHNALMKLHREGFIESFTDAEPDHDGVRVSREWLRDVERMVRFSDPIISAQIDAILGRTP